MFKYWTMHSRDLELSFFAIHVCFLVRVHMQHADGSQAYKSEFSWNLVDAFPLPVILKQWFWGWGVIFSVGLLAPCVGSVNCKRTVVVTSVKGVCGNVFKLSLRPCGPSRSLFSRYRRLFPVDVKRSGREGDTSLFSQALLQNCEKRRLASSFPSACPHGTARLPLDGLWWNLILKFFFENLLRKFKFS
jgi:hypothetical protein